MKMRSLKGWIIDGAIYSGILFSLFLAVGLLFRPGLSPAGFFESLASLAFPDQSQLDHVVTFAELLGIAVTVLAVIASLLLIAAFFVLLGRLAEKLTAKLTLPWNRLFIAKCILLFAAFIILSIVSLQVAAVDSVLLAGGIATVLASILLSFRLTKQS